MSTEVIRPTTTPADATPATTATGTQDDMENMSYVELRDENIEGYHPEYYHMSGDYTAYVW